MWDRYRLPVIITENGIADAKDAHRVSYIRSHAYAVGRAIQEGIPVQGYIHWSLMDNFEWSDGYEPRFGLYRVDYTTQQRTTGPGAAEFKRIAARLKPRSVDPPRPDAAATAASLHSLDRH